MNITQQHICFLEHVSLDHACPYLGVERNLPCWSAVEQQPESQWAPRKLLCSKVQPLTSPWRKEGTKRRIFWASVEDQKNSLGECSELSEYQISHSSRKLPEWPLKSAWDVVVNPGALDEMRQGKRKVHLEDQTIFSYYITSTVHSTHKAGKKSDGLMWIYMVRNLSDKLKESHWSCESNTNVSQQWSF